ncbi:hypothetical protein CERSUDRAFT_112862 [Gelatoporia subvermispora B]|uniref:Uncharacterized protein n=1 Tax=Ceriporiopsis subvermispora (strain B) TaxID=914234 RepID=M2QQ36_CERS8|nr:hypothetical protein CERSUDRAFT_112862 [Gelatoporia subvermispora B]
MYRAPSPPIFDVPDLPALRRVKPLPKRRRTLDPHSLDDGGDGAPAGALDECATADDVLVHGDALSAQMALSAYYQSVLGGVPELFKHEADRSAVDLSSGMYGWGDLRGGADDEDGTEGGYVDHLQQPGNTKKRKVPANVAGAPHGHEAGGEGADDEPAERGIPTGRPEREYDAISVSPPSPTSGFALRRGKLPKATLAGLQHKELLKSRKRLLANVLAHGDTLALDHALSSYPFAHSNIAAGYDTAKNNSPAARVRLSKLRGPRLARAFRAFRALSTQQPSESPAADGAVSDSRPTAALPLSDFSFLCQNETSRRLVVTEQEVAALHVRFEAELARQAARAAEAAQQAAAFAGSTRSTKANRKQGAQSPGGTPLDPAASPQDAPASSGKGKGKKKKRAVLANASNPHHLRNYVPSRLPGAGQANAAQAAANAQNLLSPLPLRFLSAELPPRRRKGTERPLAPVLSLTSPLDEWICPFCEYALFYGDEQAFQRAVRNRKKILRRRRRARERAAAAASGAGSAIAAVAGGAAAPEKTLAPAKEEGTDAPHGPAPAVSDASAGAGKHARWKEEKHHAGHGVAQSALG